MGFFEALDRELQKGLISFVESENEREGKTLGDAVKVSILESIINGDCKITGSATDHKKKKMYVEFTFFADDEREEEA